VVAAAKAATATQEYDEQVAMKHLSILVDGEIMFSGDVENISIRHGTPMPHARGWAAATAVTANYLLPDDEDSLIRRA
jgi:hypothetical protein